jgi:hypothetical protein
LCKCHSPPIHGNLCYVLSDDVPSRAQVLRHSQHFQIVELRSISPEIARSILKIRCLDLPATPFSHSMHYLVPLCVIYHNRFTQIWWSVLLLFCRMVTFKWSKNGLEACNQLVAPHQPITGLVLHKRINNPWVYKNSNSNHSDKPQKIIWCLEIQRLCLLWRLYWNSQTTNLLLIFRIVIITFMLLC